MKAQHSLPEFFVINLEKDRGKKQYIKSLFSGLELEPKFVSGVSGIALSDSAIARICDPKVTLAKHGRVLTRGEIGCALSHYKIYKRIVELDLDLSIIFEDDVALPWHFKETIKNIVRSVPSDLDLLLLGYHINPYIKERSACSFWGRHRLYAHYSAVRLIEMGYGTYAYLITKNGAEKLIKTLESEKLVHPIDHYTGNEKYLNMYALVPRIADFSTELAEDSSINAERVNESEKIKSKRIRARLSRFSLLKGCSKILRFVKLTFKSIIPKRSFKG